ncbi:hypothetical protein AMQ83_12800, partial [Paenibacillus riograndensis]
MPFAAGGLQPKHPRRGEALSAHSSPGAQHPASARYPGVQRAGALGAPLGSGGLRGIDTPLRGSNTYQEDFTHAKAADKGSTGGGRGT